MSIRNSNSNPNHQFGIRLLFIITYKSCKESLNRNFIADSQFILPNKKKYLARFTESAYATSRIRNPESRFFCEECHP